MRFTQRNLAPPLRSGRRWPSGVGGQRAQRGTDPRAAIAISQVYLESLKTYESFASSDTLFLQALEEGARLEVSKGNYAHAIELLRRAIQEDALHESSYVELMRCLWLDSRRTEALRVYQRLREVLARRLDVEPQAQTTRLYEAIRRDQAVAV